MSKQSEMKPGKNGYKIYFNTNTVVMNYKFAELAGKYGTKEYRIMKGIRRDFPGMAEIVVSGREKKSPRPTTRLTYENMEKYIRVYENADELLAVFETVKAASVALASPYKYVCDWFKAQFPEYKQSVVFDNGKLSVIPAKAPEAADYKQKMPKAG